MQVRTLLGMSYYGAGLFTDAIKYLQSALDADPSSAYLRRVLAQSCLEAKNFSCAFEQFKVILQQSPDSSAAHILVGEALDGMDKTDEAIAEFQRALELERDNAENWANLGHAYALSGKKVEALKVIDHLKELSASNYIAPYNVAAVHAGLKDKDQAFAWLDRAYNERSSMLALYLRFAELVRRIGLPH